jgi:dGTPase
MNQDRHARWQRWLSPERPYDRQSDSTEGRSTFDRDHDRVVFSAAFRRLQDKTQVFPMSEVDHTRTRLTHSLEVGCVGRSLGAMAGARLEALGLLPEGVRPGDVGTIVASAALAHDIGNPPFGHSGESAIHDFFRGQTFDGVGHKEIEDLRRFEGNAQGFRLLTRLEYRRRGGMRPTYATLGAMVKYPRESKVTSPRAGDVAHKKFGFFQDDLEVARMVFEAFGPSSSPDEAAYPRHPLAFLTEAADDICYMIIDLEDAVALGILPAARARELLRPFVDDFLSSAHEVSAWRASAIHRLTMACQEVFMADLCAIEDGARPRPLVDATPFLPAYKDLQGFSVEYIYNSDRVLEIECAGHEAITGLLRLFTAAVLSDDTGQEKRLVDLIPVSRFDLGLDTGLLPDEPRKARRALLKALSPYQRMLVVTDYIVSMTDRAAVELYQKLKGMRLPRR